MSILARMNFRFDPFEESPQLDEHLHEYYVDEGLLNLLRSEPNNGAIIFAPRGGGKTATRVMLQRGDTDGQLLLDYSRFPFVVNDATGAATLENHLVQITRLLLLKALTHISTTPGAAEQLSQRDRDTISYLSYKALQEVSGRELEQTISSLTTWDTQFRRLADWYKGDGKDLVRRGIGKLVGGVVNALDHDSINIDVENSNQLEARVRQDGTKAWNTSELEVINQYLLALIDACARLGFKKVVVLVDAVDEVDGTQKAGQAFAFVRPLLTNLYLFNERHLAFRFFLWDRLDKHCSTQNGVRRDRLATHRIKWGVDQLLEMLRKRIQKASPLTSFNDLVADTVRLDVDRIICHTAAGSPRDMIRLCREIIRKHERLDSTGPIEAGTIWDAVQAYCSDRLSSLCDTDDEIRYLTRIEGYAHTKEELAEVWGMRQETDEWIRRFRDLGLFRVVGKSKINGGRVEENIYGFSDVRIAIAARNDQQPSAVFDKAMICPSCKTPVVSDKRYIICDLCRDRRYDRGTLQSVWWDCQRP